MAGPAVETLLDPVHADRIYNLGLEPIDLHQTARILSTVTGRSISYRAETDEKARASRLGPEEWEIAGWTGSYHGTATGEILVTSHTIDHVPGHRPRTLEELLRNEPDT